MPIEPVKIPQNVYVADRIIGPITLKQIMITMVSAGISYAIWASMKATGSTDSVTSTLAWIPTIIGALFAFVKINGISLFRMMLLGIERLDKPSRRVWSPRDGIYVNIVTRPSKRNVSSATTKNTEKPELEALSVLLDNGPEEQEEAASSPVQKNRVQAERRKKPVDDITVPKTHNGGILRDVSPPPSHA